MKGSVGFLGASVTVMRSRFGMYRAKKLYGFWRMEFRIHGVCPESEPSTLNREDFDEKGEGRMPSQSFRFRFMF